ncbi:MAG: (2Fe-2S)-binding protein [Firmicutes bacterium]|nr:(2Fe-2S)-binding protein [Bacillota bacterium]MCR4723870.1 (2Fe-2S)-binding protein [Clostridia bacterium]
MIVTFILNGQPVSKDLDPSRRLIDVLREDFLLTGAKEGCGEGECGSCTILMDGLPVHACMVLAGQLDGHRLLTIEGLSASGELDILQQAFIENNAVHCGFCTPGMIMAAKGLLLQNPDPTEEEIRTAISGNICRCSDYRQIVMAVKDAAARLRAQGGAR